MRMEEPAEEERSYQVPAWQPGKPDEEQDMGDGQHVALNGAGGSGEAPSPRLTHSDQRAAIPR